MGEGGGENEQLNYTNALALQPSFQTIMLFVNVSAKGDNATVHYTATTGLPLAAGKLHFMCILYSVLALA